MSHQALRSPNRCDFKDFLKKSNVSPGRRNPSGRSFHSQGPVAEKLLSPSLLWVLGTNSFRMSFELDRSGRRPASDRRQQSSARYAGAAYLRVSMFVLYVNLRNSYSRLFILCHSIFHIKLCRRGAQTYALPLYGCLDLDINYVTLNFKGHTYTLKMYLCRKYSCYVKAFKTKA